MTYGDGNCAVEGCKRPTNMGHLMCIHHWFKVPIELRAEVNGALRGWNSGKVPLGVLRHAQEMAIKAATAI